MFIHQIVETLCAPQWDARPDAFAAFRLPAAALVHSMILAVPFQGSACRACIHLAGRLRHNVAPLHSKQPLTSRAK
jgi:hypothetical protein